MAEAPKGRLGERLIKAGVISEEQLELALKEQKRTGEFLGELLQHLGFVTEEAISSVLADQAGVSQIDLANYLIDAEVLNLVPEDFARKYKLIPLSLEDNRLTIAMANSFDVFALDEVQKMTHTYVDALSATESEVLNAIEQHYAMKGETSNLLEEIIHLAESGSISEEDLAKQSPIIRLVDQLIIQGVKDGATDIHFEPEEKTLRVRYRIDGILQSGPSIPKGLQAPTIARIKIMSDLNISENRLPQDGKIRFYIGKKRVDLRVSTFPTVFGENVVLRILDKSRLILGLHKLGFTVENLNKFKKLLINTNGIILVTGPTGSGKTTTLYSALSYINNMEKNIITLEDPVEYELPLICQSQINPKAGLTFATGLRSILRQDPDIILVGEIRDSETAEMAIRSALTGHLVFSTLHTNDSAGSIPRLLDMGMEPFLISSSLIGVMAQRLIRLICRNCKEPVEPEEEILEQLNIERDGHRFFRGKGCKECNHTGYKGRFALFEILFISPAIKKLINERAESNLIQKTACEEGMTTLFQDALHRAFQGETTLEEVLRVTYG